MVDGDRQLEGSTQDVVRQDLVERSASDDDARPQGERVREARRDLLDVVGDQDDGRRTPLARQP